MFPDANVSNGILAYAVAVGRCQRELISDWTAMMSSHVTAGQSDTSRRRPFTARELTSDGWRINHFTPSRVHIRGNLKERFFVNLQPKLDTRTDFFSSCTPPIQRSPHTRTIRTTQLYARSRSPSHTHDQNGPTSHFQRLG